MKTPRAKVAVEGLPYIGLFGFLAWVTAFLGFKLLSVLLGIVTLFFAYFFRDPDREIPKDPFAVVSPADGKVVDIEKAIEREFLNQEMRKIGIFLSITDCHVNRFPVSGRVVGTKYIPGRFFKAYLHRASSENERFATLIELEGGRGQIVVVQVAGFIARRIVSYLSLGDFVEKGERFGMIKFGSRVDLYLPVGCEIAVSVGDRVKGGETIVGWLRQGD